MLLQGQFPHISFPLLCEQSSDTESVRQAPDGTIWIGETNSPLVAEYYFTVD